MFRPLITPILFVPATRAQETVPEKTDYRATSRHADVVAFCEALAKKALAVDKLGNGKSDEGRTLQMLVLADPPVATQNDAVKSKKLVVLRFANIHAGEVDGKEAVKMLARDIVPSDKDLLEGNWSY